MTDQPGPIDPGTMRETVREYVHALHATYLDHVRHMPPGERGALPLVSAPHITVIAAAARSLHLLATAQLLPAPQGPEVELTDEYEGLTWSLRFYDPAVLPSLGMVREDSAPEVASLLGVSETLYHVTVDPGGGLGAHHAQHSGVALANMHAKLGRDLERIRHTWGRNEQLMNELTICVRLGLDRAAVLLTQELAMGRAPVAANASAHDCVDALLAEVDRS